MLRPEDIPQAPTALAFANALAAGDFPSARSLLSASLQAQTTADRLEQSYWQMLEYVEGPPDFVGVITTLQEWPARQAGDVGWAFVAISGQSWCEGVSVVVAREDGRDVIREIEWGRP